MYLHSFVKPLGLCCLNWRSMTQSREFCENQLDSCALIFLDFRTVLITFSSTLILVVARISLVV